MPFTRRIRHAARRMRAAGILLHAVVWLVVGVRSRRPLEFWIGDSNALCMNRELNAAELSVGPESQVLWHVGPRLMYSTANTGPPSKVRRAARAIGRWGRGNVILFSSAGEIDVRCHLVERSGQPGFDMSFVGDYVRRVTELGAEMNARLVVVVVPTPQSEDVPRFERFPVSGSLAERVAMARRMREELIDAVYAMAAHGARIRLLDVTEQLSLPDGSMRPELTADGVHPNADGISLVRAAVRDLLA